jgi:hypothetical protein
VKSEPYREVLANADHARLREKHDLHQHHGNAIANDDIGNRFD